MKQDEFKSLYDRLSVYADVKGLAEETGHDEELLNVIYTQRTVREAIKRHHVVKRNAQKLLREWDRGASLLQIARKWDFPPVLTALVMFQEDGFSRKEFWNYVREPQNIANPRTRKEINEIIAADSIYSPWGNEVQVKRGQWGEAMLQSWLASQGLTYRSEKDLRGKFAKTPDCLLDEPIIFNGRRINWIESKASFGDLVEFNKNIRGQLAKYVEMFGPGVVVYWFGYIEGMDLPEGMGIIDRSLCDVTAGKVTDPEIIRQWQELIYGEGGRISDEAWREAESIRACDSLKNGGGDAEEPLAGGCSFQAPQGGPEDKAHMDDVKKAYGILVDAGAASRRDLGGCDEGCPEEIPRG